MISPVMEAEKAITDAAQLRAIVSSGSLVRIFN
jgi:hypothetical protein